MRTFIVTADQCQITMVEATTFDAAAARGYREIRHSEALEHLFAGKRISEIRLTVQALNEKFPTH